MKYSAAAALLMAGLAWGQAGKKPVASAAAAPPPSLNVAQILFQQAEAGVQAVPEQDQPVLMSSIVRIELPVFPQQAIKDYKSLFQMALNLPVPTAKTQFYRYLKSQTELGSVIVLVRHGKLDTALALARTADVPRSKMYNFILDGSLGKWTLEREQALIQECAQTGSYPYAGAMAVAKAAKQDTLAQHAIVQQVYAAAGNQTDIIPFGLTGGFAALEAGHTLVPDLDAQLETSLKDIITRIGKDTQHPDAHLASQLLALLRQIDPDQAQQLQASYPELAVVPKRPAGYTDVGPNGKFRQNLGEPPGLKAEGMAKTDPSGALTFAAGQKDKEHRFRALAMVAKALAHSKPALAGKAAQEAKAMLTHDFLYSGSVGTDAATLAEAYHALGDEADAHALLLKLLDLADAKAQSYQSNYEAAPMNATGDAAPRAGNTTKVFMASQLGFAPPTAMISMIYQAAGKLDFTLAAERVQALPSDVLRPLAEAEVAGQWRKP